MNDELHDSAPAVQMRMTLAAAQVAARTLTQTGSFAPVVAPVVPAAGGQGAPAPLPAPHPALLAPMRAAIGQRAAPPQPPAANPPARQETSLQAMATRADAVAPAAMHGVRAVGDFAPAAPPLRLLAALAPAVVSAPAAAPAGDAGRAVRAAAPELTRPALSFATFAPQTVSEAMPPSSDASAMRAGWWASGPLASPGLGVRLPSAALAAVPALAPAWPVPALADLNPPMPPAAMAPEAAAAAAMADAAAPPGRAMAPPAQHAGPGGPTGGDVILDGVRMGRWVADHLAQEAGRPQRGGTAFDPRIGARWPGTLQGG